MPKLLLVPLLIGMLAAAAPPARAHDSADTVIGTAAGLLAGSLLAHQHPHHEPVYPVAPRLDRSHRHRHGHGPRHYERHKRHRRVHTKPRRHDPYRHYHPHAYGYGHGYAHSHGIRAKLWYEPPFDWYQSDHRFETPCCLGRH